MGIFNRLITVVKSNINELISKAEDPKKMLEQIIKDMNEQLQKAKQEVAIAIADEKKIYKSYIEKQKESSSWEQKAMLAVNKEDDNLATIALEKQESSQELEKQYEEQWKMQKEAVDNLKSGLKQLYNKLEEAERKKNLLIARQKRAEAQQKISQTMSSLTDSSAFDSFSRLENKVNEIEARSEAEKEINDSLLESDVESKFKQLETSSSTTQDKLAKLKAKMNKIDNN